MPKEEPNLIRNCSPGTLHHRLLKHSYWLCLLLLTSVLCSISYSAIQTRHPGGNTETFSFNSSGYLSEKKDNSRRLLMSYNESGQVVEVLEYIPPTNPTHTSRLLWNWFSDGLLRSIENTTSNTATYYLWNAQKKLEGVAFTDGTSTAYAYLPGSDLRLSSVNRSGTATLFHWDGVQLREVLNPKEGAGANSPPVATAGRVTNLPTDSNPTQTITSAYLTGQPGTWDEVLTVSIPQNPALEGGAGSGVENLLLFLQNHQSSVVGSLETSNPLVSRQFFNYLAYGEPEGTSPENLPLSGIGYTGRQHDDTGLMYYRGRYRDSCTGAFIQEDKMRDGWNWYSYTNDPVNKSDPSGFYEFVNSEPQFIAEGNNQVLNPNFNLANKQIDTLKKIQNGLIEKIEQKINDPSFADLTVLKRSLLENYSKKLCSKDEVYVMPSLYDRDKGRHGRHNFWTRNITIHTDEVDYDFLAHSLTHESMYNFDQFFARPGINSTALERELFSETIYYFGPEKQPFLSGEKQPHNADSAAVWLLYHVGR